MSAAEFERARLRRGDRRRTSRIDGTAGTTAVIGHVLSTGTDLAVGKFAKVAVVQALGTETEGQAGTVGSDGQAIYVYMLGPATPATGDYLMCRFIDNRWVADKQTIAGVSTTCPATLHLLDCDATAIAGATVSSFDNPARFPARAAITGTTGADGKYTFPSNTPSGLNGRNAYTVAWDGATSGATAIPGESLANCTSTVDLCYRHARITVTTPSAASATVDTPAGWSIESSSAGSITFAYKTIVDCGITSIFPASVGLQATPGDIANYLDNCTTTSVACGADTTVDLPMLHYTTDYAYWFNAFCDDGCASAGEGPNHRGLVPKVLHVTFNAIDSTTGGESSLGDAYYGAYANVPITLTWNGSYWDSGCLGSAAILCNKATPTGPTFNSARVTLFYTSGSFSLTFTAYADGACTAGAGTGDCSPDEAISLVPARCAMTSPVDATTTLDQGLGWYYRAHITE